MWIVNQQRFSYCWVFQYEIPVLFPSKIRNRVKFLIKNDDAQQCNNILKALKGVFPNAIEG